MVHLFYPVEGGGHDGGWDLRTLSLTWNEGICKHCWKTSRHADKWDVVSGTISMEIQPLEPCVLSFGTVPSPPPFKGTSFLKFGETKKFFCVFCYFSYDLSVAFCCCRFFCRLPSVQKNQSWWVKNRLRLNPTNHTFSLLERCNTSSTVHSTEINDCNPHAFLPWPVRKTESFLVFQSWRQGHFGDIKMKRGKSSQRGNEFVKQELVMVFKKVTSSI